MLENKTTDNNEPINLLGDIPKVVFHHMSGWLSPEDKARTLSVSKDIQSKIKFAHLRALMGLDREEHRDVSIPDRDIEAVYQLLQKVIQEIREWWGVKRGSWIYNHDSQKVYKNGFNDIKNMHLLDVIKNVCKKHPEIALTCMQVPFLKERLPKEELEIQQPSTTSRWLGAALGLLVGLIGKPLSFAIKTLQSVCAISFYFFCSPLSSLIFFILILIPGPALYMNLMACMFAFSTGSALFVMSSDQSSRDRAEGWVSQKERQRHKKLGTLILNCVTTMLMLPINIILPIIRGYETGHREVFNHFRKFVFWDERQKTLNSVCGIGDSLPYLTLAIFPKTWSRSEYMGEIFNPTIAEIAEVYESENQGIAGGRETIPALGVATQGITAMLPDIKSTSVVEEKHAQNASGFSTFFRSDATNTNASVDLDDARAPLLDAQGVAGY